MLAAENDNQYFRYIDTRGQKIISQSISNKKQTCSILPLGLMEYNL